VLRHGEGSDEARAASALERDAEAALSACLEPLSVTALPGGDYEALVAAHPPRKGDDGDWHPETFRPALMEACIEGDMTAEDWSQWLKEAPTGVSDALWLDVLAVNVRPPELAVTPKGWPATRT
jgi:hypothetical protein